MPSRVTARELPNFDVPISVRPGLARFGLLSHFVSGWCLVHFRTLQDAPRTPVAAGRPWMPWGLGAVACRGPGLEAAAFGGALALEAKEQAMSKEIRLKLGAWGGLGAGLRVVTFEHGDMLMGGCSILMGRFLWDA